MRRFSISGQRGFNHLGHMLVIVVILCIVSGAGVLVAQKQPKDNSPAPAQTETITPPASAEPTKSAQITWMFNDTEWVPSSTPPACPQSPFLKVSPVDFGKATSILYPGQFRGGNYKAHGGVRFDNNTDNTVTVTLPIDANLVSGARYIEGGTIQYLLDFTADCGLSVRFDHLLTLSEPLQRAVEANLPAAKQDDTRGTNFPPGLAFKNGAVVATAVGNPNPPLNIAVDFGLYDYRQPNAASKKPGYPPSAGTSPSQANYALCWLNELPAADQAKALALPAGDQQQGKTSDYCK